MANTVQATRTGAAESDVDLTRENFNLLLAKFEDLLAKLDADAGVTDTDYASTLGEGSTDEAQEVDVY